MECSRVQYRIVVLGAMLVAAAACSTVQTAPPNAAASDLTGAPTPRGAVERFLAAVRAQDLQAMGVVWGTKAGPVKDIPRQELEQREMIMARCLEHDSASFLEDSPGTEGDRLIRFTLYRGTLTRTTTFTVVSSPESRWYVEQINLRDVHSCTVQAGDQIR
jgi:hypothetical protein